jgi:hypothetical protein
LQNLHFRPSYAIFGNALAQTFEREILLSRPTYGFFGGQLAGQPVIAAGITTLEMHLTDQEGLPIKQAQVIPSARMTNMDIATQSMHGKALGGGNYLAQLHLSMAGPWEIWVVAEAPGFDPLQQTLLVEVQ